MDLCISKKTDQPLYRRIAQAICDAINDGSILPGQKLPTHMAMANQLGVTALTVSRSYKVLSQRGVIRQKRGLGTHVQQDALIRLASTTGLTLKHIAIVIDKPHLAQCHRDLMRLTTEMLEGIDAVLDKRRVRITYAHGLTEQSVGHLDEQSAVLVVRCQSPDPFTFEKLRQRQVPVLKVINCSAAIAVPSLSFDMFQSVRIGCEHLLACGYRKLGYIGPMGHDDSEPESMLGVKFLEFANVLYREGLDFQVRHVRKAQNEPGEAYEAASQIIRSGDLPEAFFVETDYMAMQVIAALNHAGLRVPDDIGITSMDDVADAAGFMTPLTSVRTPQYEIGVHAAKMVQAWVKNRTPMKSMTLQSRLIVRQSTAPMQPQPASAETSRT